MWYFRIKMLEHLFYQPSLRFRQKIASLPLGVGAASVTLENSISNSIRFYIFFIVLELQILILSRVYGSITNDNGYWTGFIDSLFYDDLYSQSST